MKWSLDRLFNIDRRIIFAFVFLAILLPMIWPFPLTVKPTKHVRSAYDAIERAVSDGGVVFLQWDFGPSAAPELEPAARAMIRHIFSRGGRVVVAGSQDGIGIHEAILNECSQEYGAAYGRDYVYLGYKPGGAALIINMGQSFYSAYPTDSSGNELAGQPVMRGIAKLADFDYAVEYSAGLGSVTNVWLAYAQNLYNVPVGAVVTGVIAPDLYNYINSGQLTGLLGGLVGAAQYEALVKSHGDYLVRRFSSGDLIAKKIPQFCRLLASGPDHHRGSDAQLANMVWNMLTAEQRARVRQSADSDTDKLTRADKQAIAAALNALIADQPAGQVTTQPTSQTEPAIPDSDLAAVRESLPKDVRTLLDENANVAVHRGQILRRLYVERQFPQFLARAQSDGDAVRRMVPQSVTHIGLIIVLIVGNICYLWDRARRSRQQKHEGKA